MPGGRAVRDVLRGGGGTRTAMRCELRTALMSRGTAVLLVVCAGTAAYWGVLGLTLHSEDFELIADGGLIEHTKKRISRRRA